MESELDTELQGLFDRNAARELAPEPFVGEARRRVAAYEFRRRLAGMLAQLLVVGLIAIASPWLIEASELLTRGLEIAFGLIADFLATPTGIGLTALGLAGGLIYRWRRSS